MYMIMTVVFFIEAPAEKQLMRLLLEILN